MKRVIVIMGLFFSSSLYAYSDSDLALGHTDRQLHAVVGYALTFTGSELLHRAKVPWAPVISGVVVLGLSWVKELTDKTYSSGDVKASAIGVASGCFMSFAIHL